MDRPGFAAGLGEPGLGVGPPELCRRFGDVEDPAGLFGGEPDEVPELHEFGLLDCAEGILGRKWREPILWHGDCGRDGLLAVATRHLGRRLSEVVARAPGVSYAAAAQGIRRFWKRAPNNAEMQAFVAGLLDQLSNGQI